MRIVALALVLLLVPAVAAASDLRLTLHEDGFITGWLAAGPFPKSLRDRGKKGLERDRLGGEAEAEAAAREKAVVGRLRRRSRIRWRAVFGGPKLNLARIFRRRAHAVGYLAAVVESGVERDAYLKVGTDDGNRVWWNGQLVHDIHRKRRHRYDNDLISVRLRAGRNRLLLKIDQGRGRWAASARLVGKDAAPLADIRILLPGAGTSRAKLSKEAIEVRPRFEVGQSANAPSGVRLRLRIHLDGGYPTDLGALDFTLANQRRRVLPAELRYEPIEMTVPSRKAALTVREGERVILRKRFVLSYPKAIRRSLEAAQQLLARARIDESATPSPVPAVRPLACETGAPSGACAGPFATDLASARDGVAYYLARARRLIEKNDGDWPYIRKLLARAHAGARALAKGRNPYAKWRGALYRAYRGRHDGQLQPYAVYVPADYSPRRKLPLVVALHGIHSTPMITLRRALGSSIRTISVREGDRRIPRFRTRGLLVVAPHAYQDVAFRFIGEEDVLQIIDEVRRRYRVDDRRILLTGLSMGGLGTFEISTRFPHLFAAAVSVCGAADTRLYDSVEGLRLLPWEEELVHGRSAVLMAKNLLHMPFVVAHGLRDRLVHPRESKVFVRQMKRLRYRISASYYPDLDHNSWDRAWRGARIWKRLARRPLDPEPARVVFRTATYRAMRSSWVRIDEIERLWRFADVDARARRPMNRIEIATRNVAGLTLRLPQRRLRAGEPVSVQIDGREAYRGPWRDELSLSQQGGTWAERPALALSVRDRAYKRPGLSGPLEDLYFARQLVVYGTLDPAATPVLRRAAIEASHYRHGATIRLPVKRDVDVTDEDLGAFDLTVFGNASNHALLRRMGDRLPIRVTAEGIVVKGAPGTAPRVHRGTDVGVRMIYPNPLAPAYPGRYLIWHGGVNAHVARLARRVPQWSPDYVVFDQRTTSPWGNKLLEGRPVREAGYFSKDWSVPSPLKD